MLSIDQLASDNGYALERNTGGRQKSGPLISGPAAVLSDMAGSRCKLSARGVDAPADAQMGTISPRLDKFPLGLANFW